MKRQIMKGLSAFCTSIMMLVAASSLVVSCYDDSALWDELEEVQVELDGIDQRLKNLETLKSQLEALTARVDALYTLKFQVADNNELQYSFDGGKTWNGTGIILAAECDCEPCDHECPPCQYVPCDHECPEVSLVDNGDSVTIKVGDAEFTIEKPQEIVFEIRAGKVYFESEGTVAVSIKTSGIEDVTVMAAPKGWYAEINAEGKVEITAPNYDDTQVEVDYETWTEIPAKYAASGYVKVHACGTDGKCMVGKLPVEVVEQPLSVKAFGGNAYFTVATTAAWGPTFFYGIATKETLEAETAGLMKALSSGDYNVYEDYANNEYAEDPLNVVLPISELLGEEPQMGQEYVVWALMEDYSKNSYTTEDLVIAYYQQLDVQITEVEEEKTAYNVTINVEVAGAESYVAVAMPAIYADDVDYQKEMMAEAMTMGEYYGKLYTESYTGSALDIANGTTFSMSGLYTPSSEVYVFVLPLDGRANEDYTATDVVCEVFSTAELTDGGSVDLTVAQVTEYMGEVYDYEIWDYVEKLIELDPYTQLGVELKLASEGEWSALYYNWMDEATYADYGQYDEDVVEYLLDNSHGNTPSDVEGWPLYIVEKVSPKSTMHFVAFVVDKAGKYGKVAHVELTSEELVKADYVWAEPYTTNLQDGVLKNSTTLQFTPAFEDGKEPASYKYVLSQVAYYNPYEGMDDAQVAEELFFSTSSDVKTISAEELANGVLYVEGHEYGNPYYFAIVPLDAEGNPGNSAAILEYECVFEMDNVVTSGSDFEATAPQINVNFPAESDFYPDNGWGDASYYGYAYSEWDEMYQFYYEINFDVTPAEGTEVCAVLVDAETYNLDVPDNVKAGSAWSGSYGSWATIVTSDPISSSHKYYNHYENQPAPNVVLVVSWVDAEGTYYYKEYALQEQFQHFADLMLADIYGETPEEPETPAELTVVGKQWAFDWTSYAMMMGMEHMSACLDFGVSVENYFMAGIDYEAIYGPEAAGMWMAGVEGYFEAEATDATSGVIKIMTSDWETGDLVYSGTSIEYSNLTETTCTFNGTGQFAELIVDVQATVMDEVVTVQSQGIGGM